MTLANLRLAERTSNPKAVDTALLQIERILGKGSILRFVKSESTGHGMVEASEPEAELFAIAEQVDIAERAFHDAIARRNEAQIAYLREPSIKTRAAVEVAKKAEAIALEILNAEVRWLVARHVDNRAQAEGVIRLHGGHARRQHCRGHLAALRTGNGVSPFKVCRAMTNEPIVRPFRPVSNRSMAFHSNAFSKTYKILAD